MVNRDIRSIVFFGLRYDHKLEEYTEFVKTHFAYTVVFLFAPPNWDSKSKIIVFKQDEIYLEEEIESHYSPKYRKNAFFRMLYYLMRFFVILKYLKKLKRQGVLSKNSIIVTDIYTSLFSLLYKQFGYASHLVFIIFDYYREVTRDSVTSAGYSRYIYYVLRAVNALDGFVAKKADVVWASGNTLFQHKKEEFPGKTVYLPLGMTRMYIVGNDNSEKTRPELLYIGSINDGKGLDLLVGSIEKIAAKYQDFKVNIVGYGTEEYKNKLRALCPEGLSERIVFHGVIEDNADLVKLAEKCFVGYALYKPVKYSSFKYVEPGKIKYYLSLGLPVLTENLSFGINQELYEHGVVYVSEYDELSVQNTLMDLLEKAEDHSMKIEQVYAKYNYKSIADRLVDETLKIIDSENN